MERRVGGDGVVWLGFDGYRVVSNGGRYCYFVVGLVVRLA